MKTSLVLRSLTFFVAGLSLLSITSLNAASERPGAKTDFAAKLTADDVESIEAFEKIASEANAAGISDQTILEAKLIFCIKNDVADPLVGLLPRIEATLPQWKEPDSLFFAERFQLEALIHLAKGMLASSRDDGETFEHEMKDAFWTDPKLATIVAERVATFREKQAMRTVVLPMDLVLETSQGGKATLGDLIKGQKALLLDFWASWCSPCMASMGELRERAERLGPRGIRVVGMNTESDRNKAEKVRKEKKIGFAWLVEPKERPLSKLLKIDSIPRAVLVTPDGKIAFNGHPEDAGLGAALAGLGVTKEMVGSANQ